MNTIFWLAIGLYLLLEGIGPLFFPRAWRKMMLELSQQPDNFLRRVGGVLFVSGLIICIMLSNGNSI